MNLSKTNFGWHWDGDDCVIGRAVDDAGVVEVARTRHPAMADLIVSALNTHEKDRP